jgi:hypothetical protein
VANCIREQIGDIGVGSIDSESDDLVYIPSEPIQRYVDSEGNNIWTVG